MAAWRSGQAGFTTLDALVATSVLLIGMATYSSLATQTLNGGTIMRRINAAGALASEKMEELRATPFANLVSGSDSASLGSAATAISSPDRLTRSWSVTAGPAANTKYVVVDVTWNDGHRSVRVESIVFDWGTP